VVISETLPKVADDAALVTFYESFDDRHHQMSQYADAVAAKVERFMSSGVTQIGRRAYVRKRQAGRGSDELDRDVRVVWVDFMSGAPRRLAFEHQDLYQAARPPTPPVYGDGIRYTGAPERGFSEADGTNWLVPDEFVDVALQRHQQVWSDPPPTVLYDDSDAFIWGKARSSAAIEYKRSHGKAPAPQPPTPGSARPVTVPDVLKLHSATSSTDDQDGAP